MEWNQDAFWSRVEALRIANGMGVREMARAIGISAPSYTAWKSFQPKMENIARVLTEFPKTNADYLLFGIERRAASAQKPQSEEHKPEPAAKSDDYPGPSGVPVKNSASSESANAPPNASRRKRRADGSKAKVAKP
jgi:hypothetical protein